MFRQNFAREFVCDNHILWADHEQNLLPDLRSSDAEVVESPRSSESDFACLINPLEQDPVLPMCLVWVTLTIGLAR